MKPITIPTYRRIRRRIISFKKLDLIKTEQADLIELINKSFTIPTGLFPQNPGGNPIYRARINTDSENNFIYEPYKSKEKISYNSNPNNYGRCNLIGKPIFYGADGLNVAINEACNNILNKKTPTLYLTVGEWRLQRSISVSIVCHSRKALKRSGDLIKAYQSLLILEKKKNWSKSDVRIWKIKNKFFSDEFAKEVSKGLEKNYLFSSLYSNIVLNTKDEKLKSSGLWYPSVAYRFFGHNVAYEKSLIDNGTIILEAVK
ncbi:MAG TPA: hypothetical protein VIH57_07870, partial [Bacteroidales bacterium]